MRSTISTWRGVAATFLLAAAIGGAGCKDEGIATLEGIKTKACACKDVACLEEVQKDLAAAANKKTRDMDKATKIAGEIAECMMKVTAAGAPAAAPADPAAAPAGEAKPADPAAAPADPAAAPAGEAKPADPAAAPAPGEAKPAEPAPAGDKPADTK
jgi:hypothetical protein